MFQSYEGPATFVVEDVAYPIERLRLRVRRTSEIIETHGRRRRLVGVEGIEQMILDLLEMPELRADGELRLGDGQVLPIIWTGRRFELRVNAERPDRLLPAAQPASTARTSGSPASTSAIAAT